jgi:hypothetical protein
MSSKQRNDAKTILVDREAADVIREQSLVTLEANHHYFEEVGAFGAEARRALARIYRDAFATLDALGWEDAARGGADAAGAGMAGDAGPRGGAGEAGPGVTAGEATWLDGAGEERIAVPLSPGHLEQLRARRFELGHANIDRVEHSSSWTVADLEPDRRRAQALDRVIGVWVGQACGGHGEEGDPEAAGAAG